MQPDYKAHIILLSVVTGDLIAGVKCPERATKLSSPSKAKG
jgi:hypothetical protein